MVELAKAEGILEPRRPSTPGTTLVTLVALAVAAFVGAAVWIFAQAHTATLEAAESRSTRLAQTLDDAAGRFFRQTERLATHIVGDFLRAKGGAFGGAAGGFAGLRSHIIQEEGLATMPLGIVDGSGRVALVTEDRWQSLLEQVVAGQPDRFRAGPDPEPASLFILRPAAESTLPPAPVLLGWRITGTDGGFAVLVVILDTAQLRTLVSGPVGGGGSTVGLVTTGGELLFQSPEHDGAAVTDSVRQGLSPDRVREDAFGSYHAALDSEGRVGLVAFRRVGRFPVVAVAVTDRGEALGSWRSLTMAGMVVVLGLSGVIGVLAMLHLRGVGRARLDLERRVRLRTLDERRAAERLLAAERLTHLGHWEHDLATRTGYWSNEIYRILGLTPGEHPLALEEVLAAIHPEDRDAECTARILASAGVKPYDMEFRVLRSDGAVRHVHAQAEVLRDEQGEPVKLIGTILDVSDFKQVEIALAESHATLLSVINATQEDSVMLINADGTIEVANQRAARSFGCTVAELTGRSLYALVPPDGGQRWRLAVANLVATGQPVRFEHSRGGAVYDAHLSPALNQAGRLAGIAVFERDVTARKQVEINLRLLTRAIEQSPLSVVITDRGGRIEYVNPHFAKATGYSTGEVMGKDPSLFKSGYTTPGEYRRLWETISCGKVWQGEFHNRMKNGDLHWESASIGPVRDEDGVITHFVAVKEDITRRKLAEIELLAAKERAEAASISKSQFLATISHELRTPLNAILGFSEVIKEAAHDPEALPRFAEYGRHIHTNGTHLLGLINDLLDLAKIEAGKFELHEGFVDAEEVIFAAMEMLRSRAEAGRLMLTSECEDDLPLLRGDDRAMRHILINLLSNAVKFTPEGGSVTVRARIDDNGLLELSVADTGIGIAPEDIARVLEPFGQVDNALSRRHDGTGLGLSLCRSLVEMHGGHLEIDSVVGAGTTVTVRLPRDRIVVPGAGAWPEPAL